MLFRTAFTTFVALFAVSGAAAANVHLEREELYYGRRGEPCLNDNNPGPCDTGLWCVRTVQMGNVSTLLFRSLQPIG